MGETIPEPAFGTPGGDVSPTCGRSSAIPPQRGLTAGRLRKTVTDSAIYARSLRIFRFLRIIWLTGIYPGYMIDIVDALGVDMLFL